MAPQQSLPMKGKRKREHGHDVYLRDKEGFYESTLTESPTERGNFWETISQQQLGMTL